MAPVLPQLAKCAPHVPGKRAQVTHGRKRINDNCTGKLCVRAHQWQKEKLTDEQVYVRVASEYANGVCNFKMALLKGIYPVSSASDASREAFEAHLQARDITKQSKSFMHAELAHLLHTMCEDDSTLARSKKCPAHVRSLLARVSVLAQALFMLCERAHARYVFDFFVLSVLEHMVLIEDVIASGGVVPNAHAQCCARYVEDWSHAVAQLSRQGTHCL